MTPITNAPAEAPPAPAAPVPEGGAPSAPSGATDPYLAMIERAARDPTVDLPKLEGLMNLRERMEDRRAKQAFDNAIALAKGELSGRSPRTPRRRFHQQGWPADELPL